MGIIDFSIIPLYDICDQPTEESNITSWKYQPMYKIDAKGVKREWFAVIYDKGLVSSHGTVDGVKTISVPAKIELNSSGRSFIDQASLELRSKYELKNRKEGYRFVDELTKLNIKPMLAEDWHRRRPSTVLHFPVAIQPKLDGIRCLVKEDNLSKTIKYRSRTNKLYDFAYLFSEEISSMLPFFPFEVEFDGEMYIHGIKLQNIASIVALKTTVEEVYSLKGAKKEHAIKTLKLREDLLKYNIFTIITPKDMPYEDRNEILTKAFDKGEESLGRKFDKVVLVPDHIADSMEDIETISDDYVNNQGYEGVMIYKLGCSLPSNKISESYYKSSRSYNLIKYKPFFDEEMTILSIKGGKGKAFDLAGCKVIDDKGITHEVNIADDDEVRRYIFKNPESFVSKKATVKHYGRTENGKLRHANIICIRDYE